MWITGSTLSISQRSLLPEHPPTERQLRAQDLARRLIQSYSARHAVQEALSFIREESHVAASLEGDVVQFVLAQDPLEHLGIPAGYGSKGGAARSALSAALGCQSSREPRDIDIVRRGRHHTPADEDVARRLMPRDFSHGARVELIRDLSGYLSTRDLTINEAVAEGRTVSATLLCALDTIGQVLRPSRYRGGTLHRKPSLHGQSLLKMARLYAEGACANESWRIEGVPEEASFSEFDMATHLNKAFQRGRPIAERFLHTCSILSLLVASADPVTEMLAELEHLRHGERGLFPDVPEDEWRAVAARSR